MGTRTDRGGTNRNSIASLSLDSFQIECRTQRVAALADHRSAAAKSPGAVVRRMRTAVRLFAQHPQYLGAALDEDLTLLLYGGRVDPIFRIADALPAAMGGGQDTGTTGHRVAQHRFLGEGITAKARVAVAEVPGEGLLDNDVLALLQRLNGEMFVRRRRRAQIDDVHACA